MTYVFSAGILIKRLCGAQTYYAMKREIARRRGNFRGVCPVPAKPVRNRAAETSPIHAYIARRGVRTGQKSRFVFRTRPDTHGCVYRERNPLTKPLKSFRQNLRHASLSSLTIYIIHYDLRKPPRLTQILLENPFRFFVRGLRKQKVSSVRIRTEPMPSQKTYEKGENTHGSSKEHDPHPPQGL